MPTRLTLSVVFIQLKSFLCSKKTFECTCWMFPYLKTDHSASLKITTETKTKENRKTQVLKSWRFLFKTQFISVISREDFCRQTLTTAFILLGRKGRGRAAVSVVLVSSYRWSRCSLNRVLWARRADECITDAIVTLECEIKKENAKTLKSRCLTPSGSV